MLLYSLEASTTPFMGMIKIKIFDSYFSIPKSMELYFRISEYSWHKTIFLYNEALFKIWRVNQEYKIADININKDGKIIYVKTNKINDDLKQIKVGFFIVLENLNKQMKKLLNIQSKICEEAFFVQKMLFFEKKCPLDNTRPKLAFIKEDLTFLLGILDGWKLMEFENIEK